MKKTISRPSNRTMAICAMALALLLGGARAASAQTDDWKLTGNFGFGYSSGDYGTTRTTDIAMGLATLGLEAGNFQFSVSVPYMRIDGRGLVLFDAVGNPIVINRNAAIPPDVRTGWGDVYLTAGYVIPAAVLDGFEVSVTGRFKIPTAPERRRLGTGKADYGMSVDISREFGDWKPFLTIGYLDPGEPIGYTLNNVASVSLGTSIELEEDLVAIASYDFASESSPRVDTSQDLFGSLSWIATDKLTLTGYVTTGLTSGSPNIGSGLLVSYGL